MNYIETGNPKGLPVIFIHGFPFDLNMWIPQIKSIPKKFYTIAYDVRGHGGSDYGDGQYLIEFFVDDLFELMNYLNVQKAVLVGLSMGGYIALRAAEKNSERIKGLVLCSTKSSADDNEIKLRRARQISIVKNVGISRFTEDFLRSIFSEETFLRSPSSIEMIRNIILKTSPLSIASTLIALSARTDTTDFLSKIQIPTLIMIGEKDNISTPLEAEKMKNLISNSLLHIIPNAAHMINIENTVIFNKYLFDFLNKIEKNRIESHAN